MASFLHSLRYVTVMGLSLSLMACKPIATSSSAEAKVQPENSSTAVAATVSASTPNITPQKLEQIELGSTLGEARAILRKLGQPVKETWMFEKDIDFDADSDLLLASIRVELEDGIITSKAWRGTISAKEENPITLDQFKQAKRGKTLAEIEKLIGSQGTLVEANLSRLKEGETISAGNQTFSSADGEITIETYNFLVEDGDGVIELVNGFASNLSQSVGSAMLPSQPTAVDASEPTPDVTLQNLEKIKLGSTLEEAQKILGQNGLSSSLSVDSSIDNSLIAIQVGIVNDIVDSKSWIGSISGGGTPPLTLSQWAQVKAGQSLAEVQQLTEHPGVLTEVTSYGQQTYQFPMADGHGEIYVENGSVVGLNQVSAEVFELSKLTKAEVKADPSLTKAVEASTPTHGVTLQKLEQIELGSATLEEVQAIMGQSGERKESSFQSERSSQEITASGSWLFMDDSSNPSAQIQVQLENGVIISKSWQDILFTAKTSTAPDKFEQVEIGQTFAEVQKLTEDKSIVMASTNLYKQTEEGSISLYFGEQTFSSADDDFTVEGYTFSVGDGYGSIELVNGLVVSKSADYTQAF